MRSSAPYARLPADEIAELQAQIAQLQTELHSGSEEEEEGKGGVGESVGTLNAPPPPPAAPPSAEEHLGQLQRTVVQMQREMEQLRTPRSVHRDSVSEASSPGMVSALELEAVLAEKDRHKAEVAKLQAKLQAKRQAVRSAKAVADDEKLQQVLAAVDDSDDEASDAAGPTTGPPMAPADRALRLTSPGTGIAGGLYFTRDAQALVHGGRETKELSLWDLRSGARTCLLKRNGTVYTTATSPDGQLLCVAAGDGLGMYKFTQRGGGGGLGEEPRCELQWEIAPGTRFAGVAFSPDGTLVAAARCESGVLEIRDARSNSAVKVIEDFPAVQHGDGHSCIAFSEEVLAVTGREQKPNSKQVRLYRVRSGFEVLTTLTVPGSKPHSLAMSPDGSKLAVGMCDGMGVAIYSGNSSSNSSWDDPPLILRLKDTCCTAFSHDGRLLCAGSYAENICTVWDVEAGVCIRAIPSKRCHACAFSPADDLLAAASWEGNHPVRLHELVPLAPLARFAMPGDARLPISAAAASQAVVVLASGKRLAALDRSEGRVLWQTDLEEVAFAHHDATLALRPTGDQLAIGIHKLHLVSVRDLQSGNELYQAKGFSDLVVLMYSPDGTMLVVGNGSPFYTKVYAAAGGDELHSFEDKGGWGGAIDPSNRFLAMTGSRGKGSMVSLESGEEVLAFDDSNGNALAFNDAGNRMAYVCEQRGGKVVMCEKAADGDWRETQRWDISDKFNWVVHAKFSPGDGRYLLLVSYDEGDRAKRGRIAILNTETGEEPAWSRCFRHLMLPPGNLPRHNDNPADSVLWVRSSESQRTAATAGRQSDNSSSGSPAAIEAAAALKTSLRGHRSWSGELQTWLHTTMEHKQGIQQVIRTMVERHSQPGDDRLMSSASADLQAETIELLEAAAADLEAVVADPDAQQHEPSVLHEPLILQAAIGEHLYLIDVAAYIHAFEEDGNFSLEQLNRLSDSDPEAIPLLLEKWPHVVNFRDQETGDTVMHHCARAGKPESTQKWLSGSVSVAQLENKKSTSALREAVLQMQYPTAREMIRQLDPTMPLSRTELLTKDVVAMGERFPRQIVGIIKIMLGDSSDGDDTGRFRLFRPQKEFSLLKQQLDTTLGFAVRASESGDPDVAWPEYIGEGTEGLKCDCQLQVLTLGGFVAMSDGSSPYTRLFRACEAESESLLNDLLSTKLMDVATVYKFQTYVSTRVWRRLYWMLVHFALAAVAMLMSTQYFDQTSDFYDNGGWTGEWSVATVNAAMSCDVLQGGLMVSNTLVFVAEIRQLQLAFSDQKRRNDEQISCAKVVVQHMGSYWNRCDIAGVAALYVASVGHFIRSETMLQQVGAVGVLLNAFSLLQLLRPFKKTGPLIKTVIEILADIEGYMYIVMVLLWGFSVSFAVSMPSNKAFQDSTAGPLIGLVTSFEAIVGSFHMSEYHNAESTMFFLVFLFLVVVVMLNLLIAIMSDSYEKVKESEVVEARKLRAQTIIDEEALMSEAERSNPDYFPRYLQVLQATETKEEVWAGLSGKMVSEIMKVDDQLADTKREVTQEVGEVKQEVGKVKQEVGEVKQEVGEVKQEVGEMHQKMMQEVGEMKQEVGELKALIAQHNVQNMTQELGELKGLIVQLLEQQK